MLKQLSLLSLLALFHCLSLHHTDYDPECGRPGLARQLAKDNTIFLDGKPMKVLQKKDIYKKGTLSISLTVTELGLDRQPVQNVRVEGDREVRLVDVDLSRYELMDVRPEKGAVVLAGEGEDFELAVADAQMFGQIREQWDSLEDDKVILVTVTRVCGQTYVSRFAKANING